MRQQLDWRHNQDGSAAKWLQIAESGVCDAAESAQDRWFDLERLYIN